MRIATLLYDGVTALDAVGPHEILARMPGAQTCFVAAEPGRVATDHPGLHLFADLGFEDVAEADVLLVPGGPGTAAAMGDERTLEWIRRLDATTRWTTSVCSGSLLLGAAGLLQDRRATSHWIALEYLPAFGAEPVSERIVFDGRYATAAGVSAGIDLALALAGRIAGDRVAEKIQLVVEYDPQPPYTCGSAAHAPTEFLAELRADELAVRA